MREVAPQADPATRTFQVKVGITDPPEAMRLGATVTGSIKLSAPPGVEVPASALTEADGRPAVWVVDPKSQTVSLRNVDVLRYDPADRRDLAGPGDRRARRHRRGADAAPRPEGPPPGSRLMKRFNLSEWAIRHRSLVTYFMLVIVVAGVWSYLRLGRSEDPDFTVKTMVVQVGWPGATVGDTLEQITDRIERKLAGDAEPRLPEELHDPGQGHDLRQPEGFDAPGIRCRTSGIRCARRSTTSATHCRKASSAPASTTSSAIPTASSTASPPTGSPIAS